MKARRRKLRKDSDACVLRYEVHCLRWRNDIVSVLGSDGHTLCCIHDCLKHYRIKTFRKQNPLILGQIPENQAFFASSGGGSLEVQRRAEPEQMAQR